MRSPRSSKHSFTVKYIEQNMRRFKCFSLNYSASFHFQIAWTVLFFMRTLGQKCTPFSMTETYFQLRVVVREEMSLMHHPVQIFNVLFVFLQQCYF